jgi:ADP-L-glycero-D-manno-heptose 6-epimerase
MILVTGAYGFIGSTFVKFLNSKGITDIEVSDYLTNGEQFVNLKNCGFRSFVHPDEIDVKKYKNIFHFGAISDTTCWDGELILKRNYSYTINLIEQCIKYKIPISYSSSASVYGNEGSPLNLYAYSKWLVDQKVDSYQSDLVQGFKYFNVYSTDDAEWHKKDQASPFYKFKQQAKTFKEINIFEGSENFYRDFVHVDQVCEIQWLMSLKKTPGIFDLGSGVQKSFKEVAEIIAKEFSASIKIVPFPEHLKNRYQTGTLADMSYLLL